MPLLQNTYDYISCRATTNYYNYDKSSTFEAFNLLTYYCNVFKPNYKPITDVLDHPIIAPIYDKYIELRWSFSLVVVNHGDDVMMPPSNPARSFLIYTFVKFKFPLLLCFAR